MKREPISIADATKIEALPLLRDMLPYQFGNKISKIEYLSLKCSGCGKEIEPSMIRAKLENWNKGDTVSMLAYGMCRDCNLITPVEARFHADGTSLNRKNGVWTKGYWQQCTEVASSGLSLKGFLAGGWKDMLPPVIAGIVVSLWILSHKYR